MITNRILGIALMISVFGCRVALAAAEASTILVVDSVGTVVGPVIDFEATAGESVPRVALNVDGHATLLAFWPAGQVPKIETLRGNEGVYFASSDCTGQGYMQLYGLPDFEMLEPQATGGPNYTFYAGPRTTPVLHPCNSALFPGSTCQPVSAATCSGNLGAPVFPVTDLVPQWQPPFHIELGGGPASVPAVSPAGLAALVALLGVAGVVLLLRRRGWVP